MSKRLSQKLYLVSCSTLSAFSPTTSPLLCSAHGRKAEQRQSPHEALKNSGQSLGCPSARAGWPSGHRPDVPGGLLHLCPPAVVGVADQQQDLAPEQHQGRVRGHHGAHPCVQPLQAVETAVGAIYREESGGSSCDSSEHSYKQTRRRTKRETSLLLIVATGRSSRKRYTLSSFLYSHIQSIWRLENQAFEAKAK